MMKRFFGFWLLLSFVATARAAEQEIENPPALVEGYVDEAKLPKGWPLPGPYDEVVQKEYPVYRVAVTQGGGRTRSFWTLFQHIQAQGIPMTAPVEMAMSDKDGAMEMTAMGFLYQDTLVGEVSAEVSPDGGKVAVSDVPALTVLSYAWLGANNEKAVQKARAAIDAKVAEQKLAVVSYRLLGYNGPRVPKAKRTHELQAILAK